MRLDTLRILCAIKVIKDLEVNQMDIKGAYLNGIITEEIYMRQPPGFVSEDNKVCHLCRSLYGLKQAGREWNRSLNLFLSNIGFQRATKEHCLYFRTEQKRFDVIGVWVDDLLILSKSPENISKIKNLINQEFKATHQGTPKYMLGIEIELDIKNHAIRLSQERYINKIIDRFDLNNERLSDIPMTPHAKFSPSKDDENLVNITLHRSAIGSLMSFAIATHPDIAFAVNTLAQFNVKPSQTYWNAVIKIFRYLKCTKS